MIFLSNEFLKVAVSPMGAELQSVISEAEAIEYVWGADPAFWPKKSPVLFPIVGGLNNNAYLHEGKAYSMNRHGFSRESLFTVSVATENKAVFTLRSNEKTQAQYPFDFLFSVIYTLEENRLTVAYQVENTGLSTMYFSVGAHPAFNVPLSKKHTYQDYFLKFSSNENTGVYPILKSGLIACSSRPFFIGEDVLPLKKELFYGDALVFKALRSGSISLLNTKDNHGLTMDFNEFPYMGIWAFKDADFVCLEPWFGIGDTESATGELKEKEGINALAAGRTFEAAWTVSFF